MYYNLFQEVVNPDLFHICGNRIHWKEIPITLKFTLKGKEENESVLDHPISIAYVSFFTSMVGRKLDKIRTKREKIRKRHYKETMTFSCKLKRKKEIFSFLTAYHQGKMQRAKWRRKKEWLIPNLTFFQPFSFVDPETMSGWDRRDQPPIRILFFRKKKTAISLFRHWLKKC